MPASSALFKNYLAQIVHKSHSVVPSTSICELQKAVQLETNRRACQFTSYKFRSKRISYFAPLLYRKLINGRVRNLRSHHTAIKKQLQSLQSRVSKMLFDRPRAVPEFRALPRDKMVCITRRNFKDSLT